MMENLLAMPSFVLEKCPQVIGPLLLPAYKRMLAQMKQNSANMAILDDTIFLVLFREFGETGLRARPSQFVHMLGARSASTPFNSGFHSTPARALRTYGVRTT